MVFENKVLFIFGRLFFEFSIFFLVVVFNKVFKVLNRFISVKFRIIRRIVRIFFNVVFFFGMVNKFVRFNWKVVGVRLILLML